MTRFLKSVRRYKVYLVLAAIFLFAGFVRFYNISEVPVSLYWDEVSQVYSAYSILETGKDEYGNSFPLLFRAFEDYKTPANIYLTAISVKLFGLNEFSARFSSAFLGTLSIFFVFLFIKELFRKVELVNSNYIALLAAFLVAISPWHILFSRAGFEANSGLFIVILAMCLFLKYINTNLFKYFIFSMISFSLTFYFYRSLWIFVPLLITGLFIIYPKTLFSKENLKKTILGILIFFIVLSPFIPKMLSSEGFTRSNQASVINNSQEKVLEFSKKQEKVGGVVGKIIFNRRVVYTTEYIEGYLSHFSPNFLFFNGDSNLRHGVRGVGVLYLWGAIFIIPGIIALLRLERKTKLVIIIWILAAPVAAALSVPTPHALRSLYMIPMIQLIVALGMIWIYQLVGKRYQKGFILVTTGIILYFFVSFISSYFGEYSKYSSSEWADGYRQLAQYVFENENKYEKVIISGHFWQPYIYFLFYSKYDPSVYQASGDKKGFGKYLFGGTSWDMAGRELGELDLEEYGETPNLLIALSPIEYSLQKEKVRVVHTIINHNNEPVFFLGELNDRKP